MASFFGDWSQCERFSDIKQPLPHHKKRTFVGGKVGSLNLFAQNEKHLGTFRPDTKGVRYAQVFVSILFFILFKY